MAGPGEVCIMYKSRGSRIHTAFISLSLMLPRSGIDRGAICGTSSRAPPAPDDDGRAIRHMLRPTQSNPAPCNVIRADGGGGEKCVGAAGPARWARLRPALRTTQGRVQGEAYGPAAERRAATAGALLPGLPTGRIA
eukprot:scaffold2576_cov418-Prasinococcus_capsulatus_cf.AAC.8